MTLPTAAAVVQWGPGKHRVSSACAGVEARPALASAHERWQQCAAPRQSRQAGRGLPPSCHMSVTLLETRYPPAARRERGASLRCRGGLAVACCACGGAGRIAAAPAGFPVLGTLCGRIASAVATASVLSSIRHASKPHEACPGAIGWASACLRSAYGRRGCHRPERACLRLHPPRTPPGPPQMSPAPNGAGAAADGAAAQGASPELITLNVGARPGAGADACAAPWAAAFEVARAAPARPRRRSHARPPAAHPRPTRVHRRRHAVHHHAQHAHTE